MSGRPKLTPEERKRRKEWREQEQYKSAVLVAETLGLGLTIYKIQRSQCSRQTEELVCIPRNTGMNGS